MSNSDDNYIGVLLEEMRDELKAVHELVADQPTHDEFNELKDDVEGLKTDVATTNVAVKDLSRDLNEVKDDVRIIKAAVTDQSKQLQDHHQRITNIEATIKA